jgi:hypothetical protein
LIFLLGTTPIKLSSIGRKKSLSSLLHLQALKNEVPIANLIENPFQKKTRENFNFIKLMEIFFSEDPFTLARFIYLFSQPILLPLVRAFRISS